MMHQPSMPQAEQATQHSPTLSEAVNQPDELARRRLTESTHVLLRSVTCELRDGQLILAGSVPTYYLKQMAQTLVSDLAEVEAVINQIDVG